MPNSKSFLVLGTLSQLIGVCAVIMCIVWMSKYQGGFAWGFKNELKFNYHPLFMVIGLIFIYGDAILVYRVFRNENKFLLKLLHMIMQLSALGFAIFGLTAVFSAHNDWGYANLYSIHSWIGIITVIMFGLQFLLGFTFYLFPKMSEPWRVSYMTHHRHWGVTIFCMACAAALMGIVENTGFKVKDYSARTPQAYAINFLGLFIVLFGWIVTYLVTNDEYRRPTDPADNSEEVNLVH